MSEHLKRAEELRAITERHYNCAQSVFVPFAKECGLDEEEAYKVAANFGAGMKVAGTCGAITGGLMVLGMLGILQLSVNISKLSRIIMKVALIA